MYCALQDDILRPLTSVDWVWSGQLSKLSTSLNSADCVTLTNVVYIKNKRYGGGDKLWASDCTDLKEWRLLNSNLPTQASGFTTYHSQLVLVGGIETSTGQITNKLWTSTGGLTWEPSLPPMPTPRYSPASKSISTSASDCLVVAGGKGIDGRDSSTVEVLMEQQLQWIAVEPLPVRGIPDSFTLHSGELYLCFSDLVCYCDANSLTQPAPHQSTNSGPLWKTLATPGPRHHLAYYGQKLIGLEKDIRAYYPITESWLSVGGVLGGSAVGCMLLPTGDLLVVIWDGSIFRTSLSGEYHDVVTIVVRFMFL